LAGSARNIVQTRLASQLNHLKPHRFAIAGLIILLLGYLPSSSRAAERSRAGEISVTLPAEALLIATSRWGSTTLSALDLRSGAIALVATKPSSEMDIAEEAGRVAYLVREGSDPTRNYVEILDLRKGRVYRFTPPGGFALLGFAFSPNRSDVAYTAMSIRKSRSRRAYWRSALVNVETGEDRTYLSSGPHSVTGEAIPIPFGWSPTTGHIYFRGLMPFRGMIDAGIWAGGEPDSNLRSLLPDSTYVGRPTLSPDGSLLAYLSTEPDLLPVSDIRAPGAPAGNALVVMDLKTGQKTVVTEKAGVTFDCVGWSAAGDEVLIERRESLDGRVPDLAFLSGTPRDSFRLTDTGVQASPDAKVRDIARCRAGGPLFWTERDAREGRLRSARGNHDATTLLTVGDGEIRLIGCMEGNQDGRR